MTAIEVLEKTADLLQGRWGQGDGLRSPLSPSVCVETALARVCVEANFVWPAERAAAYYAIQKECSLSPQIPLYQWNDAPGRTEEEVIATVRNAKRHLHEEASK